jgi:hypothetical protein
VDVSMVIIMTSFGGHYVMFQVCTFLYFQKVSLQVFVPVTGSSLLFFMFINFFVSDFLHGSFSCRCSRTIGYS